MGDADKDICEKRHTDHAVIDSPCTRRGDADGVQAVEFVLLQPGPGVTETCHDRDVGFSQHLDVTGRGETKPRPRQMNIFSTSFVCAALFGTGLCFGIWGPVLLDLTDLLNTSSQKIALIFTARSVGGLMVMVCFTRLFDILSSYFLYMVALAVAASTMAASPFCPNLEVLLFVTLVFGASLAMILTGGNTIMIRLWKNKAGPILQGIYLAFICGVMLAPQIARPFLAPPRNMTQTGDKFINETGEMISTPSTYFIAGNKVKVNITSQEQDKDVFHTNIVYAFVIIACFEIILLIFAFGFLWSDSFQIRTRHEVSQSSPDNTQLNKGLKYFTVFLFAFFNMLTVGADLSFGSLVMTFCVKYLKWQKSQGTVITSVYYGAQIFGRAIAVPIIRFVKPQYYIAVNSFLAFLSIVMVTVLINSHQTVIWFMTGTYGVSITGLYPASIQWLNNYVPVTGSVSGLVTMGIPIGFMSFPALAGWLLEAYDAMWFLYIQTVALSGCLILLVILFVYLRKQNENLNQHNVIAKSVELDEISEKKELCKQNHVKDT